VPQGLCVACELNSGKGWGTGLALGRLEPLHVEEAIPPKTADTP
jgi:hypothetical protein